ncbi:MAG: hypothetical protein PHT55_00190 [Spirochaetales bacterium]|nr:hypothetical protein [Spirochaetales bacterium]
MKRAQDISDRAERIIRRLGSLSTVTEVPDPKAFFTLTEAAIKALEAESGVIRPRAAGGGPGGLIQIDSPWILIVPDLHARAWLLLALLGSRLPQFPESSVLELILRHSLSLLCLGDIPHSEGAGAAKRWSKAATARLKDLGPAGVFNPFMEEEMALSLAALRLVMELSILLGEGFHCLKGNHDNLSNSADNGDLPFYKYAQEGSMGAEWLELRYGRPGLELLRRYELLLPLAARGRSFCASHAEPAFAVDYNDILEYRQNPGLVRALIWTGNGEALPRAVEQSLEALLPSNPSQGSLRWIAGHRPVVGSYALRASGRLVQVHNPGRNQAVLLKDTADAAYAELSIVELDEDTGILRLCALVPPC